MKELKNDFSDCVGFTINKVHIIERDDDLTYTVIHFTNGHILVQRDDNDGWNTWSGVIYDLKRQDKALIEYLEPYLK